VIPAESLEAFCPLCSWAENSEVQIEFGHTEDVCKGIVECCDDLLMFVAVWVDWEALNVLKYVTEGVIRFWYY
jgi:hypothetical protein